MPQVELNNCIHTVPVGTLLSEVLPGLSHPCGGKGVCGKCKVRVSGAVSSLTTTEQRHLTPSEIADGIRLACCATVEGDCRVEMPSAAPVVVTAGENALASVKPVFARFGAAVDIGTTTLAARLYAPDGSLLAEMGAANPQTAFGEDVLTRVESALGGKAAEVIEAIRTGLTRLLADLTASAGLKPTDVDGVVVTGNTVMLTLLTGGDVTPFATAPFSGHSRFGIALTGAQIGLMECANAAVYLAPCVSAFVGGDAATALLATELGNNELLLDIGTNGEMVLNANGILYACSTAAGPAFEGVGISCGMVAAPGAIDRVDLINGAFHAHVIGGGKAAGVCGSGLVDALACLSMLDDPTGPISLAPGIVLTIEDIQALLTSKSAIRSGLDTLLHTAGLSPDSVSSLTIAGGFGRYLNIPNAIRVGLLPPVAAQRVRAVGNAALDGASRLLLNTDLQDELRQKIDGVQVVDLATNPYFVRRFMESMNLEVPR